MNPVEAPLRGREGGRIRKKPVKFDACINYLSYLTVEGDEVLCLYDESSEGSEYILEPVTIEQALASPQAEAWKSALNAELAALLKNQTWTVVDMPNDKKPIPCKWVFKIKRTSTGQIERYKCRLVAKGFKQIYGVDYVEISAPVARMATIRTVLALAAANDWNTAHVDNDSAFLHGKLNETIYMEPPPGFDICKPGQVLKLNKCIYGLKQAPLVWYETLKSVFTENNYSISMADPSMLILVDKNEKSFALIYVDDQMITGPNDELNARIKNAILEKFPGKDLGEVEKYVGLTIKRNRELGTMKLYQPLHIDQLVTTFGQTDANPVYVPMDKSLNLFENNGSPPHTNVQNYISLVGSLLYISIASRPDIAYAASVLSRFNHKPSRNHWLAAIKVLRYLKTTRNFGLVYGNNKPQETNNKLQVISYCDSEWAQDEDNSLSAYGDVFKLNGAAVSWASKKQDKIAHSSGEAEYVAASFASREALWMHKIMEDCDLKGPIPMYLDNNCALNHTHRSTFTPKTKHIRVHVHAVLERCRDNVVIFGKVHTSDMMADIFTKPLDKTLFQKFRDGLGVME